MTVPNGTSTSTGPHALSDEQSSALAALSQRCAEHHLLDLPDGTGPDDVRDSISDETALLRYLQARKFDPAGAFDQFHQACRFRKEKRVFEIHDGIRVADFETAIGVYPHWTGRRDKRGLPICFASMENLNKSTVAGWKDSFWLPREKKGSAAAPMDLLQLASVVFDNIIRFLFPLCTAVPDRPDPSVPITSAVIIIDAASLSLKQGFDLRGFARDVSVLLSTNYPETIDRVFVCNVPSYFSKIWSFLKSWVDPVTAEKLIFLTPSEALPELQQYIDNANIPTQVGGKMQFEHGTLPDMDAEVRKVLNCERLPKGPWKWVQDGEGRRRIVAVGSVDGEFRREEVAVLGL